MLASMRKVEPEMMMDLKDVFERLDVNGSGTVQKEDLVLAAQKRRAQAGTPTKKGARVL